MGKLKKANGTTGRMDRTKAVLATFDIHDQTDIEEMAEMSYEDKSRLITYLREAQYGIKATTGRLQRFYRIVKLK